jgi:O-antigen/teichoic acid export membrane protein
VAAIAIEPLMQIIAILSLIVAAAATWVAGRTVRSVSHGQMPFSRKVYLKRLMLTSLPLATVAIAEYLNLKIDSVMLSVLDTDASVGLYAVAFQILLALITLPLALTKVFFPNFVEILRSNSVPAIARMLSVYGIGFLVYALTAVLVLVPLSEWLVVLLFSEEFISSAGVLKCLLFGLPVVVLNRLVNYAIVAMGRNREYLLISVIGVAVNVGLNITLIPDYSVYGAAVATIISEMCVLIGGIVVCRNHLNVIDRRSGREIDM